MVVMDEETPSAHPWPPRVEVIDERMAALYRRMTGQQRVARGIELFHMARQIVISSVEAQHPNASAQEKRRLVHERMMRGST